MIDFDAVHGDNLTYYLTGPSWLKLDSEAERLHGIPEQAGQYSVELRVEDSSGASDTQSFGITVSDTLFNVSNVDFVSLSPDTKPEGFLLEWPSDSLTFEANQK